MYRINSNFVLRGIYDVTLLIPVRSNPLSSEVISLNETAALIFRECKNADTISDLVQRVQAYFQDAQDPEIQSVLSQYIESLIEQGYIERS